MFAGHWSLAKLETRTQNRGVWYWLRVQPRGSGSFFRTGAPEEWRRTEPVETQSKRSPHWPASPRTGSAINGKLNGKPYKRYCPSQCNKIKIKKTNKRIKKKIIIICNASATKKKGKRKWMATRNHFFFLYGSRLHLFDSVRSQDLYCDVMCVFLFLPVYNFSTEYLAPIEIRQGSTFCSILDPFNALRISYLYHHFLEMVDFQIFELFEIVLFLFGFMGITNFRFHKNARKFTPYVCLILFTNV